MSLELDAGADDATTLADRLEAPSEASPLRRVLQDEFKAQVAAALRWISPRDGKVLRLRFGLDDGQSRTLEQVGQVLGITRERVRQIETRALAQLRGSTGHPCLKTLHEDQG